MLQENRGCTLAVTTEIGVKKKVSKWLPTLIGKSFSLKLKFKLSSVRAV